jgi:acetylornithine deacetylase/succinyl-diaminopimelate desuccinylase-like protein
VPSERGISHNPDEYTEPADLAAGADVLLHVLWHLANHDLPDVPVKEPS